VIANRCICKTITRDLSLVASRLYRMAVTWPESCVAVTRDRSGKIASSRCRESDYARAGTYEEC